MKYDPAYEKSKIFNFDDFKELDFKGFRERSSELMQYGAPVFASQITTTISVIMDLLLAGMVGPQALADRKIFGQIALFINPFIVASAQSSGEVVMDANC